MPDIPPVIPEPSSTRPDVTDGAAVVDTPAPVVDAPSPGLTLVAPTPLPGSPSKDPATQQPGRVDTPTAESTRKRQKAEQPAVSDANLSIRRNTRSKATTTTVAAAAAVEPEGQEMSGKTRAAKRQAEAIDPGGVSKSKVKRRKTGRK